MNISPAQQKANRLTAMKFFVSQSYSPEQSAGIVGNLMQESGMDPSILQYGYNPFPDVIRCGGGFGLPQWTSRDRKLAFEAFALQHNAKIDDINIQLQFIVKELQTTERVANSLLVLTKTPADATKVFCSKYERPGKPEMDKRIKYAKEAYEEYMDTVSVAPTEAEKPAKEHWLIRLVRWALFK